MKQCTFFSVIATAVILMLSCAGKNTQPDTTTPQAIDTTNTTSLGVHTIPTTGGTITIAQPGSSLDGMSITVPTGSFSHAQTVSITAAEIKGHLFGSDFHPASPLITIAADTGYANDVITLRVPARIPAGSFGMGFIYDGVTKKLEGIPVVAEDSASVSLALRHFSAPSSFSPAYRGGSPSPLQLLISVIDTAILYRNTEINTGFAPGVDDWEFVNFGSYIAPGGHCAGQSISALWYYYEKKLTGSPALYHLFDRVAASKYVLWQDNPRGFRFASTVQEDIDWSGKLYKLFEKVEQSRPYHHLSWKAFAYTMLLTRTPQFVGLTSDSGGHAIVAYKVNMTTKTLFVADPNFPGQSRSITFNGSFFDPYSTKQNDHEPDVRAYHGVGYYATTSMVDWNKIGARWNEFTNNTIGNDRFPAYTLQVHDGSGYELDTTLITDADTVVVSCKSTGCAQWTNNTDHLQWIQIYDATGALITSSDTTGKATLLLSPGPKIFGFTMQGCQNSKWRYLDFRWITITNSKLVITPVNLTGFTDTAYTYTVTSTSMPAVALLRWTVYDSSKTVIMNETVNGQTSKALSFSKPGRYTIAVSLYDSDTTKLVAKVRTTAAISAVGATTFAGSWQFQQSFWPRMTMDFAVSGSVAGLEGNRVIKIDTAAYGNVYVEFSQYDKLFSITASATGSLSPAVVETLYTDTKQRDVYRINGSARWGSYTGAPDTNHYVPSSSITVTEHRYYDLYMNASWPMKYETYDSNNVLIAEDTGYFSIPMVKIHFTQARPAR
ncbi:MAG: hypothetical protein JW795_12210 [Chitinivibrionales bacterium]|nr:hypothetical protein [Chitinivibrionales bacterium]